MADSTPNELGRRAQASRAPDEWKRDEWKREVGNLRLSLVNLGLEPRCTDFFRWYTDRLQRFEHFARRDLRRYQRLRVPAVVVAAVVPAVAAVDLGRPGRLTAAALSAFVAAALGVEAFLGSGRRWVHFRAIAEALKAEGRLYLARAGFYSRFTGYDEAFPLFAERVGNALQHETEDYVSTVIADLNRRRDDTSSGAPDTTSRP